MSINLTPKDSEEGIVVPFEIISASKTLDAMLSDIGIDKTSTGPPQTIPLGNISMKILKLVVEYCQLHHKNPKPPAPVKKHVAPEDKEKRSYDISAWEKEFLKWADGADGWDDVCFFELILAAEYLAITDLLDLCMQTLANLIKGKSVEEFRRCFKIKNDWTPEEEERVSKEVECFEER